MTSAGTTTFAYDFESRATSITGPGISQTNVYNGLDTRTGSTTNSVAQTYLRDGAYVTDPVLKDSSATYTPGVSERRGSATTFLHSGLKNADTQTGTAQTVSATRRYDAFGNVVTSTGIWNGPFGYAGGFGYQEDATGLKLLGHRYYDSSTGRFLSRDPIKDGRNWFVYCVNSPISNADPTGLAPWAQRGILSVLINRSDEHAIAIGDYQDSKGNAHIIGVVVPPGKMSPDWLDLDNIYVGGKYYEPHNGPVSPHQQHIIESDGYVHGNWPDYVGPGTPLPRDKIWDLRGLKIWRVPLDDAPPAPLPSQPYDPGYNDPFPGIGMPKRLGSNSVWN